MSGPKLLLRLPPLRTEAITTVIPMMGIITLEDTTDMVGTLEEVGTGTTIPMAATRIAGIIGGRTGPVVVEVAASRFLGVRETHSPRFLGGQPLLLTAQLQGARRVSWRSLPHIAGQAPERGWFL